uniref:Uncharacterized protein n=1 Tax=Solanum lycopersicum TaxID=4081 RepID=A0A3Q7FK91_SOLLC
MPLLVFSVTVFRELILENRCWQWVFNVHIKFETHLSTVKPYPLDLSRVVYFDVHGKDFIEDKGFMLHILMSVLCIDQILLHYIVVNIDSVNKASCKNCSPLKRKRNMVHDVLTSLGEAEDHKALSASGSLGGGGGLGTRRLEVPTEGGCGVEGLGSGRGICRGKGSFTIYMVKN